MARHGVEGAEHPPEVTHQTYQTLEDHPHDDIDGYGVNVRSGIVHTEDAGGKDKCE